MTRVKARGDIDVNAVLDKVQRFLTKDLEFTEEEAIATVSDEAVIQAAQESNNFISHCVRAFVFHLRVEKGVDTANIRRAILSSSKDLTVARAASIETDMNALRDLLHLLCGLSFRSWERLIMDHTEVITILPLSAVKSLGWWRNLLVVAGYLEPGPLRTERSNPGKEFYVHMLKTYPSYVNHPLGHSQMQLKLLWETNMKRMHRVDLLESYSKHATRLEAAYKLTYMRHYADILVRLGTKSNLQKAIRQGDVPFLTLDQENALQPWRLYEPQHPRRTNS